ncbi:MAG: hypothetical protein PHR21_02430 [Oscillospiraceae bacterium]|nr:hypothetical protein [Oscillospiraceae bacterium]MDD4367988.1 hypothetical protein [Oscillospiraceae bacterium]
MTAFFIIMLIISVLISIVLGRALLKARRQCMKTQAVRPYQLFVPTLLAAILLLQVGFFSAPKMLDCINLAADSQSFAQVQVSKKIAWLGILTDQNQQLYHYNPLIFKPLAGETYSLRYLPHSHYITTVSSKSDTSTNSSNTTETTAAGSTASGDLTSGVQENKD